MTLSDEAFREAYKPIHVPAHYNDAHSVEEKIIFALAQLGEGTAKDVQQYLSGLTNESIAVKETLNSLFISGRVNGRDESNEMRFDLNKIISPNDGAVNPDLLAPGLD